MQLFVLLSHPFGTPELTARACRIRRTMLRSESYIAASLRRIPSPQPFMAEQHREGKERLFPRPAWSFSSAKLSSINKMGQSWSERCLLIRENRCWQSKHSLICTTEHGISLQQRLRGREHPQLKPSTIWREEDRVPVFRWNSLVGSWTALGKLLGPPDGDPHTMIFEMDVCLLVCRHLRTMPPFDLNFISICAMAGTMQQNELNGNNARKLTKFIPSLVEGSVSHSLPTINGYYGLIPCRLMLRNPQTLK